MGLIKNKRGHYVKTISTVAIINMVLAVLALVKDIGFAGYLGTSAIADALILAYFITDMLGNNLFATAVGISTIPTFSKLYVKKGKEGLYGGLVNINIFTTIISFILILSIFIFKEPIINVLGYGFSGETKLLTTNLLNILLPTILLYPLVTAGISSLQIVGKFNIGAFPPILLNAALLTGIIISVLFNINTSSGVYAVTASIVVGVVCMVLLVYIFLPNLKVTLTLIKESIKYWAETRTIIKLLVPVLFIFILSQAVYYIERFLASSFGDGSVAALNYAFRLSQFPIWVFVGAIGAVTFPLLAITKEKENLDEVKRIIEKALIFILIVTIPMVLILNILRNPIITLLFLRGAFDDNSLKMTSLILMGYSISILGQSMTAIFLKVCLTVGDISSLLKAYLISVSVNIIADIYLVKVIGLAGIGYGAAIGGTLNALLLVYFMKRKFGFDYKNVFRKFVRIIAANIPVIVLILLFGAVWDNVLTNMTFLYKFIGMAVTMLMIVILYYYSLKAVSAV
jgi:murein biosynthesis integral membrane protein MurJ